MQYFITGTDTDVGKTYVTRLLLEAWKRHGTLCAGYKPFCCGSRQDSIELLSGSSSELQLTLDEVNPQWFRVAASPFAAGLLENRKVDLDAAVAGFHQLKTRCDHLLVEGAGGWEVPLTDRETIADFAERLDLPVIVIVNNKLGALNHTLLTVRGIAARGLHCAGIILNHVADERDPASISHRHILELHAPGVPILTEVMHGESELDALC